MYKNKFCREEAYEQNEDLAEDEEYKSKAKAHAPEAAKAIMHKLKLEYGDKFNPEKARSAVKHALGSATEEDCESWMQDKSHTPEQKKEMAKYEDSTSGEAAEEVEDFKVGDYISGHDGSEYEVVEVLPCGDIVVTIGGGSVAGRKMRVGKGFLKHFNKVNEEEDAEEELGPDPKEADELEAVMKKHGNNEKSFFRDEPRHEPDFNKTDVWKAYKAVLAGQWSEQDFETWSRSLWAAGADESQSHS